MLSILGSRIILNLRGVILKEPDEVNTQESVKLVTTRRTYKSWNTNPSGSPLPQPVQSTLITFVESPVGQKSYSDW